MGNKGRDTANIPTMQATNKYEQTILWTLLLPVFYLVILYSIVRSGGGDRRKIYFMLATILLTLLMPIVINQLIADSHKLPLLISRYQWFLFPLYFIALSAGITKLNKKFAIPALIFFVILYSWLLYDYYFLIDAENWSALVGV